MSSIERLKDDLVAEKIRSDPYDPCYVTVKYDDLRELLEFVEWVIERQREEDVETIYENKRWRLGLDVDCAMYSPVPAEQGPEPVTMWGESSSYEEALWTLFEKTRRQG